MHPYNIKFEVRLQKQYSKVQLITIPYNNKQNHNRLVW